MNKYQSIAAICAIVALVVLFFAPTKSSQLVPAHLQAEESHEGHDHEMPGDLDEEVRQAVELIQKSAQEGGAPMAGINKLKGVLAKDPNHEGALTQLGYFSMQTGQYEKAIERFEHLVNINPENKEAVFMLAQAQDNSGNAESAVQNYEKFLKLYPDYPQAADVEERIKKLTE